MDMNKTIVYLNMLKLALPYIRNIQTHRLFRKATDRYCYYEAELVHHLTKSLLNNEIEEHDIHFLNNQAKYDTDNCNARISLNYDSQVNYIKCLFIMVPADLHGKLNWSDPQ